MTSNYPRIILWAALGIALWFNYLAWMRDYPQEAAAPSQATSATRGGAGPQANRDLELAIPKASNGAASAPVPAAEHAAASAPGERTAGEGNPAGETHGPTLRVHTDVLDVEIALAGGTLVQADLPKYPRVKGHPEPVRLLNRDGPETFYVLRTGLTGPDDAARPTHLATFTSPQSAFVLEPGRDELRVPLTWSDGQGVEVTKTFVFRRGEYRIDIDYSVQNHSTMPWDVVPYAQIVRNDPPTKRTMFNVETYSFHGPAIFDGAKYRKLNVSDADDRRLSVDVKSGWLASLQHHFVAAIVPPADALFRYTLNVAGNEYALAAAGQVSTVPAGGTANFAFRAFVGPKLQSQLEATAPLLDRVADYGRLWPLAQPLFWLLEKVYSLFGNWGVAIIVVTFLLKLAFYPLSEASGRSMAKMKALAPRIKNIQETYKDDREKAGRAMMELYQREKLNPVAGCLPMIIQIPVFLAFYWVLLESVEMRQAPFMGWINDLSSRDPYFVLPAIMMGAMFVQYKLNPAPPDPVQAKLMMFMPLVMSVTFAFFPAGLVLYWVTNTILSIAQQWNINRRIEAAAAAKKA
jgi:YidC/Oxa1 family membrane protein insertase